MVMLEPEIVRKCEGHHDTVSAISFSPTGKQVASASMDSTIMIWNSAGDLPNRPAQNNSRKARAYRYEDHKDAVYDLEFSPNGQLLASASRDRTIRLWVPTVKGECKSWQAHTGAVRSVTFSPDGRNLLSASDDKSIKYWSTHKQQFIRSFSGHQNWVRSAKFCPDGSSSTIVSGSDDKTVKIWDNRQAGCVHTFHEHGGFVNQVAFHPGGKFVASAGSDACVRIWDLRTQRLAQYYSIHGASVNSLDFHPNGQWLLTAGSDNTCKLLDVIEGQTIFTLHGHNSPVTACAFSTKGDKLASGSADETVHMWNSNLESFALDHEEKKREVEDKKRENREKSRDLKVSQRKANARLASPVKHKVTDFKVKEDGFNPWIPAHAIGAKSYNCKNKAGKILDIENSMKFLEGKSRIEKVGNARQNLTSSNGIHGMQRPNTAKALENQKIQQNQVQTQTKNQNQYQNHHENTTMVAQNEVLTATVGAMEARMSVIENHLQECMLELKTEKAKSQITEEQNRQLRNTLEQNIGRDLPMEQKDSRAPLSINSAPLSIPMEQKDSRAPLSINSAPLSINSCFDTQKLLNAVNPVISQEAFLNKLNSHSDTYQNYPVQRKQSKPDANSDGQLHPPSHHPPSHQSLQPPSHQNSRNRLHKSPVTSENLYETCENLEIDENLDISRDIIRTANNNDFIEEDTPTPRETQPQKSERAAPPVETVQIFSRNDTHNSGNSTPRDVSTPLDKPRHSNPAVSPLPPGTNNNSNNNSQHENIGNNVDLENNENNIQTMGTNGNFASNPLEHVNLENNNALKTANSNSSLASSMSHYSESAEETRQQALKSLDELRRSLTEAVANSISSLEQSTANSNTDEKSNEKR